MRRAAALLAILSLATTGCREASPTSADFAGSPNILLIISDDHGYGDFGFMGSPVAQTPNIDRLAHEGTVFPLAYNTASTCRPSLTTLLTGLDPTQWRATTVAHEEQHPGHRGDGVITAFDTLPRLLGRHGYATLQTGKFWTGTYGMAGFSHGLKTLQADSRYVDMQAGGEASLAVGRTTLEPVKEFIDAHQQQPFFVWFAPMLPHTPHDAPKRFRDLYAQADLSAHELGYFANVSRLDATVGALVAHLESRGLRERTLIVFLSDNGWETERRDEGRVFVGGDKGKSSMFELGWRTPLIFNWPGAVAAGETRPSLASTLDLFPTLLEFARVEPLPQRPGQSLVPVLEGADPHIRDVLFGSDRGVRPREYAASGTLASRGPALMARTERWHYIWNSETDADSLYDMREDAHEEHNVAAQHLEVVRRLREQAEAWHATVQKPIDIVER